MNYQLATHQEVERYSRSTGVSMGWPAIMAETDDHEVKGIIATEPRDDAVVAGPIIATSGIVALKLINKYEEILKKLNITTYLFSIETKRDRWIRAVKKEGRAEIIEESDTHIWFKRKL